MAVDTAQRRRLITQEQRLWDELWALTETLSEDEASEAGYFSEGWSAKDVLGHIGSWLAEAGIALEQLRMGTYSRSGFDVETLNQQCLVGMKDLPFDVVRAQAVGSRTRMRNEWAAVDDSPEAELWVRKAGPEHYGEHLPRLREWVADLHSRRGR